MTTRMPSPLRTWERYRSLRPSSLSIAGKVGPSRFQDGRVSSLRRGAGYRSNGHGIRHESPIAKLRIHDLPGVWREHVRGSRVGLSNARELSEPFEVVVKFALPIEPQTSL